ncbi:MAG: M48 family metallopeptidase [Bacteroidetes bacterium]|nr:M48 family metallopeptidase [Bacteroidota bacterium]
MKYVGLQTQIWRNNTKSTLLLIAFPVLLLFLVWIFFYILYIKDYGIELINQEFLQTSPFVAAIVGVWFLIAYFSHTKMISKATSSKPLERNKNMRVYNLVENLCISVGMKMPKVKIIYDDSLNAFASGINEKSYTVTLSKGIIDKLNDRELEGVIAHELTHIRNKDVRLLIVSIIFVGIFALIAEVVARSLRVPRGGGKKGGGAIIIIILALALVGYLLSALFRFALSRKREYLADAGAAEMTRNPDALASALRKISEDSRIEAVARKDVAQLFIENPREKGVKGFFSSVLGLFATHPPMNKRVQLLEQF